MLALVGGLLAVHACPASADQIGDCEAQFLRFAARQGAPVRAFTIERGDSLDQNRFDDRVGSQRVSSEYIGFARLTDANGSRRVRFVCLHEGDGKRAVYVGVLMR